ncbi:MAG: SDR family NAD(P)-dependent oxidoreductase [Caldilineaceae bacterium]
MSSRGRTRPGSTHAIAGLDVLVHNAGLGYVGALVDQPASDINTLIDVNLRAPVLLTRRLLPRMAAQGRIVFVSSLAAVMPTPDYAVYSATKAALDSFAANLRLELQAQRRPVHVQVIHPGAAHGDARQVRHARAAVAPALPTPMRWQPPSSAVARGRRQQTIGAANRLAYHGVRLSGTLIDRLLVRRARRASDRHGQAHDAPRDHALITGAADGIGRALALALARQGYAITGVDVDAARADAVTAELRALDSDATIFGADLAQHATFDALLDRIAARPPITLLVHNAGINAVGPFATVDPARPQAVIDVNLRAPLLLTRDLLRARRLEPGSTVVCLASLSHVVSYPGAAVYAATKDGLASYARSLAPALAADAINVLTVFPGPTRTAHARRYSPDNRREQKRMPPDELAQRIVRAVEQRRMRLIPGAGNRVFAAVGRVAPWLTGRVMQRTVFVKLIDATGDAQ